MPNGKASGRKRDTGTGISAFASVMSNFHAQYSVRSMFGWLTLIRIVLKGPESKFTTQHCPTPDISGFQMAMVPSPQPHRLTLVFLPQKHNSIVWADAIT
ncbi:hypothetical protein CIB48_g11079 [Xylaria polymorpha]|nr:hypothetical protein CIB48_g11079 [Xylaria polymorpha]